MSYRANKQASTKYSPFFLLFGKQIRLPIENDINPLDNTHESEYGIEEEIDQRLQSLLQKEFVIANSKMGYSIMGPKILYARGPPNLGRSSPNQKSCYLGGAPKFGEVLPKSKILLFFWDPLPNPLL